MINFPAVAEYIEDTVVQAYVWDTAPIAVRKKSVNRAELILRNMLPDVFGDEEIPAPLLGEQAVWILKIDDTIERADLGMKNVWVDGTMITVTEKDNSICPTVFRLLGIPMTNKGKRRRVGSYDHPVGGTGRWGNRVQMLNNNYCRQRGNR